MLLRWTAAFPLRLVSLFPFRKNEIWCFSFFLNYLFKFLYNWRKGTALRAGRMSYNLQVLILSFCWHFCSQEHIPWGDRAECANEGIQAPRMNGCVARPCLVMENEYFPCACWCHSASGKALGVPLTAASITAHPSLQK